MSGERMEPLGSGTICFGCDPDVECFTECCRSLNLTLTPYDILRLARHLEMPTSAFLDRYTYAVEEPGKLPRVRVEMEGEDQLCPFLTEEGCSVYEDRPSACRAYPLARAAAQSPLGSGIKEAFFVLREEHCKGFDRGREWTPAEWCRDQGLDAYTRHNDDWMTVLTRQGDVFYGPEAESRIKMHNLAAYDLDGFRRFVLESGLAERLSISERRVETLAEDDEELLRFAMQWLRFALFGVPFNPERP